MFSLAVFLTAGCNGLPNPSSGASPRSSSEGVSIPVSQLTPLDRCMLDKGFRITKVRPAGATDAGSLVVEWESDLPFDTAASAASDCRQRFAPSRPKTEAEIRAIYAAWVEERKCLIGLGYNPVAPPSVEKFVSDWQTGPWMPIDGIDTNAWTDEQYQEAKQRCGLEMYDRG